MLLTKKVNIVPHNKKKYYESLGYIINNKSDEIEIDISHLTKGSNKKVDVKCDICGKEKSIPYIKYIKNISKYDIYSCSPKCSINKNKKTNITKYGVDNPMKHEIFKEKAVKTSIEKYSTTYHLQSEEIKEKIKKTNIERYGYSNPNKNKNIREKIKQTNLSRYGTESTFGSVEIKNKSKQTLIKRYGVDNPMKHDTFKEKAKNTIIKNYGYDNAMKSKNISSKVSSTKKINIFNKYKNILKSEYEVINYNDNIYELKHIKCGNTFSIKNINLYGRFSNNLDLCLLCNPIDNKTSSYETEILKFISKFYSDNIITNDRDILEGKELDIYIPEFNLAIEFNGLYWHSELYKDKNYHLEKTLKCKEKSIELIHIFEDDWLNKREIVESILLNKINKISNKIYARKCVVKEVKSDKAREFLDTNHIQGFSKSKYKLGLYHNNELVSLMTFGYRKTNSKKEFELIRFCNKLNTSVLGAGSKLFKYFIKNYKIEEDYILSYADVSMFNGDLYKRLGFNYIHRSKPNYFWVMNNKREHRWKYNKQNLIKEGFDGSMTEVEIMHSRGSYRIYGCGQDRYEYRLDY